MSISRINEDLQKQREEYARLDSQSSKSIEALNAELIKSHVEIKNTQELLVIETNNSASFKDRLSLVQQEKNFLNSKIENLDFLYEEAKAQIASLEENIEDLTANYSKSVGLHVVLLNLSEKLTFFLYE